MTGLARLAVPPLLLVSFLLSGGALAADTDGDGVDDAVDNCLVDSNSSQEDTDGDGCGNACDADYDQNGGVSMADFAFHRDAWLVNAPAPHVADLDDDGFVGGADFINFRASHLRGVPGPSLVVGRDPIACP